MGQRLNIEIKICGKVQANAYYHWSGYTDTATNIVMDILKRYTKEDGYEYDEPKLRAIKILEASGAGLTQDELNYAKKEIKTDYEYKPCEGRNAGLIAISQEGMRETRQWEEARVTLDFDKNIIKFNVWFIEDKEDWEKYDKFNCRIILDLKVSPFYMTIEYFISDFSKFNFGDNYFTYKNLIMSPI